ncbi:MAG TPA: SGNH/GDSL hydrolase family protein [Methylocella sp.]
MSRNLSVKSRYAVIFVLLCLIALMETCHPFPFFRLATFMLAFLALACVASLLRGKLRDSLVVLASLAFGLSTFEAIATISETTVSLVVATKGLAVLWPDIGWGPGHAGRFHAEKTNTKSGVPIYSADYTIDSNLLREIHSVETGPAIVFFGDSFTFGIGVNDADTLPQIFADLLGRKQRVLNLGVGGFGPQQFFAQLQTGRFDGVIGAQPQLFIFTTFAGHAERTACKPFWTRYWPRFVLENGHVALKGECYQGSSLRVREWLEDMASYRLFIEPYLQKATQQDFELYIGMVLAAVNLAKEKYGVATLIPYIRDNGYLEGTGFSDDEIIQRLRDGGAVIVDVSLANEAAGAKLRIEGDGHPTPWANRLRALIIKDYIENRMPRVLVAGVP